MHVNLRRLKVGDLEFFGVRRKKRVHNVHNYKVHKDFESTKVEK